jgi:hypothetical protein
MKQILFILILYWPLSTFGQSFVNPDTIYQAGDIYLQNTDVYYTPFQAPGDSDTRVNLCSESDVLRDPNGVGDFWRNYLPIIYDTALHKFDSLMDFHLPGLPPLGRYVIWERLFTARDKPDHTHSDIIVGSNVVRPDTTYDTLSLDGISFVNRTITNPSGPVTVSKNEDVDFRASGTIKMENGFHVMPGAFFHAYQEPRWGAAVLSDDFDSSKLNEAVWHVTNGSGEGAACSNDSNVIMDTDYQATDGHVADLILRENPRDTFSTLALFPWWDRDDTICSDLPIIPDSLEYFLFSEANLEACPFPYNQIDTPHTLVYQHVPFGKYEVREKLPHILFHTNNWGGGTGSEYDINETWNPGEIHPAFGHQFLFGPCRGWFRKNGDTVFFISPEANWSNLWNNPNGIAIDGIMYGAGLAPHHNKDTVTGFTSTFVQGGFPAAHVNSGDTVSFYYMRYPNFTSDVVTWKADTDSHGHWSIIYAPYRVFSPGDTIKFDKAFQPVTMRLTVRAIPDSTVTFNCRWDSALNAGTDTGYLVLMDGGGNPDSLLGSDLHTFTEAYPFAVCDYGTRGTPDGMGQVQFDTLGLDSASDAHWATTPYKYHVFSMEWLPNEIRFLLDSNVIRRWPDHLLPVGNRFYDWPNKIPRGPVNFRPAEWIMNPGSYPLGVDSASRAYFEAYDTTCSGCGDVTIGGKTYHAAHQKVDYIRIWDVPSDVKIPNFSR